MDAHFDRALNCEKTSQNDKGSLDGKLRDCNGEDNNDVKRLITYKNGNGRELTLARSLVKAPVRCMSTCVAVRAAAILAVEQHHSSYLPDGPVCGGGDDSVVES